MSNYNPHAPDIVGQEWAPIIDSPYQPDITEERGYTFTVSKAINTAPVMARYGRYSLTNVPSGVTTAQVPFMSLYRSGRETNGPILKTIIECADAVSGGPDGAFFGTFTGGQALRNASDDSGYSFTNGTAPIAGTLDCSFDTTLGLPAQVGRIYNLSILYAADGDGLEQATLPNNMFISLRYRSTDFYYSTGALDTGPSFRGDLNKIARISLGEINPNWSNATWQGTNERYPWTSTRLALFSQASGDPMRIRFQWGSPTLDTDLSLHYIALEMTYSPFENRLLYGGMHKGIDMDATGTETSYGFGSDTTRNFVMLRTPNTLVTGTGGELVPGEYTVTFNLADYGDTNQPFFNINAAAATNTRPTMYASRELYALPDITGVEIERAFTVSDTIGVSTTHLIPGLGIGITGSAGPAGGADVYTGCAGYQAPQAGDAVSIAVPNQDFRSDNKDGALQYPWIRFYARQTAGSIRDDATLTVTAGSTVPSVTVSITSSQLAALPEIFDGWREVTLRFADGSFPVYDGDAATLRNIAWNVNTPAATSGVAFQVLGELSLLPWNNAKYQGQIGVNTKGNFPFEPGTTGDYTFLFSTDPPPITGIGVAAQSVALTGIGTDCGLTPQCVPTAVACNRVTWNIPNGATVITDTFDRTVANGWGTATSGQAWTTSGGAAADYAVSAATSRGTHSVTATNSSRSTLIGSAIRNFDITTNAYVPNVSGSSPAGAPISMGVLGRWVDASNFYEFRVEWQPGSGNDVILSIRRTLAGSPTTIGTAMVAFVNLAVNDQIRIRASAQGSTLSFKVWDVTDGESEPDTWQVVATDTNFVSGQVGLISTVPTGNTNTLPISFAYDSFSVRPTEFNFGYYELQRMDDDTSWQTIMKATSPSVTGFNDFEARIGMRSDYRIRQVNVYEFPGLWSATVSNTLTSPVTGTGADGHELLVFTSNTNQTDGQTLAYEEVWDSNPTQEMSYFEGNGMVQFQRMYRRNFQTAFHSLERGGVQFERTLLVQNAAVPAPILENAFRSLRDMAWDDLPYICVRTNLGDRWYAAVEVPSGTISRGRRLQLVQVKITESADTPFPVDPPGVPRAV